MGRPSFIEEKNWISLGTPNVMGTGSNRAQTAFINNTIMNNACDTTVINDNTGIIDLIADNIQALPTPFQDHLNIKSDLRFEIDRTKVEDVLNWSLLGASVNRIRIERARLTLSNATQIANEVANGISNFDNQTRHGGDTVYVGGMTDFPGEDTIDISGTLVASTFTLFDGTGTQVGGTNQTGNFMFPNLTHSIRKRLRFGT